MATSIATAPPHDKIATACNQLAISLNELSSCLGSIVHDGPTGSLGEQVQDLDHARAQLLYLQTHAPTLSEWDAREIVGFSVTFSREFDSVMALIPPPIQVLSMGAQAERKRQIYEACAYLMAEHGEWIDTVRGIVCQIGRENRAAGIASAITLDAASATNKPALTAAASTETAGVDGTVAAITDSAQAGGANQKANAEQQRYKKLIEVYGKISTGQKGQFQRLLDATDTQVFSDKDLCGNIKNAGDLREKLDAIAALERVGRRYKLRPLWRYAWIKNQK